MLRGNLEVDSNQVVALVNWKFKRPVPISSSGISIGSPSLACKAKTVDIKDSDNEINRYDLAQLASTSNKCIYICDFDSKNELLFYIEQVWKEKRDRSTRDGVNDLRIETSKCWCQPLTLVCLFNDWVDNLVLQLPLYAPWPLSLFL